MRTLLSGCLATLVCCLGLHAAQPPDYARNIASLIDPARLKTLVPRGAHSRVQKCLYWLATARSAGQKPEQVLDLAVARAGYSNPEAARLTKEALLRNLALAEKSGCLEAEGLAQMRLGKAATARRGPHKGRPLGVDHIIPRSICPELDNVIANLDLTPALNTAKRDKIGARQRSLARKLCEAGLLSRPGLAQVLAAK
jgi:hypothetical protein